MTIYERKCPRCGHAVVDHLLNCQPMERVRDAEGWLRTQQLACGCPFTFSEALANAEARDSEPHAPGAAPV